MLKTKVITLAASMAALSIILDFISVRTDISKFTIYGLPLLIAGILFGPVVGGLAGIVSGFISQLISPYGLTLTTPLWMLAPIAWGLVSGLLSNILIKDKLDIKRVVIIVITTSLSALILNSLAMYLDGVIFQYPTAYILTTLLSRVLIALGLCIPYCVIVYLIYPRLVRFKQ